MRIVDSSSFGRRRSIAFQEAVAFYLFASPVLLGLVIFTIGPILASLYFSFNDMIAVNAPMHWIGLQNFVTMLFRDPLFWTSLGNTIYYVSFAVPLQLIAGLGLAVLLNQKIPGLAFLRTLYYMPVVVPAVAASVLWIWIFNGDFGLLNIALSSIGLPRIGWLTDPSWAKPAFVLMSLWGIGGSMILYLAGLQGVPTELMDAAEVDGANRWVRFRHVTIPMISPVLFFNLIMGFIGSFQIFVNAYVMTGGGPLDSTRFYMLYLYQHAFQYFNMGYASAMAWGLFILIAALTAINFWFIGPRVYYEMGGRR